MLASTDVGVAPSQPAELPLLVKLPSHMANFFKEVGYAPSTYMENRAQARMRVRCESVIQSLFVPPFARRSQEMARVLVKDLSRGGISVISHQQMWPTETFSLELHGRTLSARVVRCRKLGECCYEVGAVLFAVTAPQDEND